VALGESIVAIGVLAIRLPLDAADLAIVDRWSDRAGIAADEMTATVLAWAVFGASIPLAVFSARIRALDARLDVSSVEGVPDRRPGRKRLLAWWHVVSLGRGVVAGQGVCGLLGVEVEDPGWERDVQGGV
jgi:hypothetical protein